MTLETARLRLVPFAPGHLLALIEEPERLEERMGFPAADGLRGYLVAGEVSPTWVTRLRAAPPDDADPWAYGFAAVDAGLGRVVAVASFKGPPDAEGVAEIAYAVAPAFEGRGYATEAAAALVAYAFEDGRVRAVRAHTLPRTGASPRVLQKCGFRYVGEVEDPEDGPVWRWERARPA